MFFDFHLTPYVKAPKLYYLPNDETQVIAFCKKLEKVNDLLNLLPISNLAHKIFFEITEIPPDSNGDIRFGLQGQFCMNVNTEQVHFLFMKSKSPQTSIQSIIETYFIPIDEQSLDETDDSDEATSDESDEENYYKDLCST